VGALQSLCAFASDDGTRLALELRLAMLLEGAAESSDGSTADELSREALVGTATRSARPALGHRGDGLARLSGGEARGPYGAAFAASTSLAELATDPRPRALSGRRRRAAARPGRRRAPRTVARRAAHGRSRPRAALDSDADCVAAAGRLATVRSRTARGSGSSPPSKSRSCGRDRPTRRHARLGDRARRARRAGDLVVAIDAMRRVREAAPSHVPSLLTLAELCIAQRSWPEAVEALEAVVERSPEPGPRLTALFALASVYEKVLEAGRGGARPAPGAHDRAGESERPARAPPQARLGTHAGQARRADARQSEKRSRICSSASRRPRRTPRRSARSSSSSRSSARASAIRTAAERALIEAVAQAPQNARAFARLGAVFRTTERDATRSSYARALSSVVGRGTQLGHVDARWLATVGQLEVRIARQDPRRDRAPAAGHADGPDAVRDALRAGGGVRARRRERGYAANAPRDDHAVVPAAAGLADPGSGLELLERALGAERRSEEALVVSELRAVGG
jgi:hypothetical protein